MKSVAQLRADLAQISRRLEIEDQAADELHRRNEALYARLLQIRAARQHQEEQQQQAVIDDNSNNNSDSDDPGHITPDHRSMDDPDEASLECDPSRHEEPSQDAPPAGRAAHYCSSDATGLAGPDTKKRKSVPDQDGDDDDDDQDINLSSNELEDELEQKKPAAKRS